MSEQLKKTVIIYLIGTPGTGKYTIAKEISKSGYMLCDNQLVNNPIFSLIGYDGFGKVSHSAWNAIGRIRNIIFDFISREPNNNYIFTNVLCDNEEDNQLFNQVEQMALHRNSIFVPVKLLISEEENIRRIEQPERKLHYKSRDKNDVLTKFPLIQIIHKNLYALDVTNLSANSALQKILMHVANCT